MLDRDILSILSIRYLLIIFNVLLRRLTICLQKQVSTM
nr:MAG TPA: hypothetical protein [Caudoviricetes sp.]